MKCNFCDYEWKNMIESPKSCPRCKHRLDYPTPEDRRHTIKGQTRGGSVSKDINEVF